MGISIARGLLIGTILLWLLPAIFFPTSIWFASPLAEIITCIVTAALMHKYTQQFA